VDANGFELTPVFPIYQWGFGIYSDKYKSVSELPEGAVVAVPIDGANQGQALWLLQREGIIGLNSAIEPRVAKIHDITDNPHKFVFKELDLLTLPRILDSVDAAIGYVLQFDAGKISREKGILFPAAPRTFASQLVIGTKYLNDPQIKKLQQAFKDKRLDEYLRTTDDPLVQGVLTPVSDN
jgi:ABC-type metal ion transport system substrate-binding protein